MIQRECAVCSKIVKRYHSQIKSQYIFCSRVCHYKGRSLGFVKRIIKKPYNISERGKLAWKEAGLKRKGKNLLPLIKWTCEICNKQCSITRGKMVKARKLRFCSQQCANIGLKGKNNPAWRGGHEEYYGKDWRTIQRLARQLDNNICQRCGIAKKELGKNLDVHHLKRVYSFENVNDANYIENVVCLCHICHLKIEWNRIDFVLPKRCNSEREDRLIKLEVFL